MNVKVKVANTVYEVEIDDLNARPVRAVVDGETFEVWPAEGAEPSRPGPVHSAPKPVAQPQAGSATDSKIVYAPLPGVVTEVFVTPGREVAVGDPLLVIEAMKMKNTVRAVRPGRIISVCAEAGQTVAHRQELMEYEA
jgi:glutaconyl-CoA/methylmalonyl-CoA decarboxylase subunit gamma